MTRSGRQSLTTLLIIVCMYVALSMFAYSLRHPHLTSTEVFLDFSDAMRWR